MSAKIPIAIIADFDPSSKSHAATADALAHTSHVADLKIEPRWIATDELEDPAALKNLAEFGGLWVGPGSPYRSMVGALAAIRFGRESRIPLLGTCGGFQHIILDYARNVLSFTAADHEESAPGAKQLFISRLACSLVGRSMTIQMAPDSMLAGIYGKSSVQEEYLCNFGVNPAYEENLRLGSLRAVASDAEGSVRGVELPGHPFFIGTLFLPQHRSSASRPHPLISAFVRAAATQATRNRKIMA